LSYFGIATSLVLYLTKVIHQDLKTAVKNVNYWAGVTTLMPLLGGFLADAYLGRYSTVIASCIVYLMVSNLNHHSIKHLEMLLFYLLGIMLHILLTVENCFFVAKNHRVWFCLLCHGSYQA